jgi:hypothetical protein
MTIIKSTSPTQTLHRFANGYGASVITDGYGKDRGLLELAVVKFYHGDKFHLNYETPITDDVLGYLTQEDVDDVLAQIEALDPDEVVKAFKAKRISQLEADMSAIQKQIDAIRAE